MWTYSIIAVVVAIFIFTKIYEYLDARPERMRNLGCCMGCSGLGLFLLVVVCVGGFIYLGLELHKPDLPIKVSGRDSSVGMGKVMIIENQSDQDLPLKLECVSSNLGQMTTHTVNIPARQTKEYGWLELNWQFEPGEDVFISHPDYKTLNVTVP